MIFKLPLKVNGILLFMMYSKTSPEIKQAKNEVAKYPNLADISLTS